MTVTLARSVARNEDFTLVVEWTQDGEPVDIAETRFTIRQGETRVVGTVTVNDETLTAVIPMSAYTPLVDGAATYDLLVQPVDGTVERLVAGTLAITEGASEW